MSHFAVAVIHREDQDVETLLAPYDENIEVEPYIEYTRQQAIEHARKYRANRLKDASDEECWKDVAEDYEPDRVDADGNLWSTYNPKSKWDWWSYGGRWSGELITKSGEYLDECLVKEIDTTLNKVEYRNALRFWDVYVDKKPLEPGETEDQYRTFYKESYFKDRYLDRETYAKCQATFCTRAVVTPDGEWHEAGEMGWFGCSSETGEEWRDWVDHYKERFIDPYLDMTITMIDCHI